MRKKLALLLAVIVSTSVTIGCSSNNSNSIVSNSNIEDQEKTSDTKETYTFGSYEQDNNISNGKEPIEWIVLEKRDNSMFLLSKYALDCQPCNETGQFVDSTWESCTLRKWLNESFIDNAFNKDDKILIQNTSVTADKNPKYEISPGNDTIDKIFIWSIDECNKYFNSDDERKCIPTEYAIANGVYTDGKTTCDWWLRTPGDHAYTSAYITHNGHIIWSGWYSSRALDGVRPALWIKLD